MSTCAACGACYDDTFKFCPHCGRAKPEPESINLNVRVAPVRYEEAVLKIEVVGTAELTEPPFDYRPSRLTKLLGEDGKSKNWTSTAILRLLLESTHPDKGKYLAYASGTFRGFIERDFKLPNALVATFTALKFTASYPPHKWLLDLFDERHQCWDEFNWYLISEGWIGLTQHATDRKAPLYDDPNLYINRNDGNLSPFFKSCSWLLHQTIHICVK